MALAALAGAECAAVDGDWQGQLSLGPRKLPLIFHFNADGQCTLDSPAQGATGIEARMAYCDNDSVAIEIAGIGASYRGRITAGVIDGVFTQGGFSLPLTLSPELSLYERRPQTPRTPFPYITRDTTFASADGSLLAATLTMPDKATAPVKAVVFITGSGPQDRDEQLFDHRPFAVIADFLARNGVASLRYDDRGTGKSGGDFSTATLDSFREDASAAVKMLRGVAGIGEVGVIGHSEGGTIALRLAADHEVDFTISLAGAMVKGKDLILAQNLHALDQLQMTSKQRDDVMTLISVVFDDIIAGKDYAGIRFEDYIKGCQLDIPPLITASMRRNLASAAGPYFRQILSLDPSQWLSGIKVPVFALNGTLDTQVDCDDNLAAVAAALPEATVKPYQGLNHLFQHASTGDPSEYPVITETISPEVLTDILHFILGLN